jgi:hypothetical protein
MKMRTVPLILAAVALAAGRAVAEAPAPSAPATHVDGSILRTLIDEDQEITEVDLDGVMLQAIANSKGEEGCAKGLISSLTGVHAVIGTVKGPAENALTLVKQTDQSLIAKGWKRVTRIKDETSWVSVLTHLAGDKIDGLVALIFDTEDKELVFVNLTGAIDITNIGEIGECLNVPGLEHVPGAK